MTIRHHKTREEWLAGRRLAIGGSDIAAILGLSGYKDSNPMSVWLAKTGQGGEREVTPEMEWGLRHETALKEKFKECHPELSLASLGQYDVISMASYPWASCTPDDLIGDDGILETKATGWRQAYKWGDEQTDDVPPGYLLQCQWNMGVTGRKYCYLVPLIGGSDYREYRLIFDEDLFSMMLSEAEEFWTNHVLTGAPPDLDGSESTRAYLDRKHPGSTGEVPVVTADSAIAILDRFAILQEAVRSVKNPLEVLKNKVIDLIGENDGVLWPGGKITYKRPKDTEVTDWKAAFAKLHDQFVASYDNGGLEEECVVEAKAIASEIVRDHTTTKVNSRRFVPTIKEGYVREIEFAGAQKLLGGQNSVAEGSGGS